MNFVKSRKELREEMENVNAGRFFGVVRLAGPSKYEFLIKDVSLKSVGKYNWCGTIDNTYVKVSEKNELEEVIKTAVEKFSNRDREIEEFFFVCDNYDELPRHKRPLVRTLKEYDFEILTPDEYEEYEEQVIDEDRKRWLALWQVVNIYSKKTEE